MPDSLVNLGELAEPATKLIEKLSVALGAPFIPWYARQQAKAALIKAEADARIKILEGEVGIEVSDLMRRALYRAAVEEANEQANMEAIAHAALPQLEATARPDNIDT